MLTLENAVVYDIETLPNAFTITAETLHGDTVSVWEISQFRDDRTPLIQWFNWLHQTQTPMIGFNNEGFDYPVLHMIYCNPQCTVDDIYNKAMSIIRSNDRFANTIWPRDRFAPQIDLFKIHHFDNKAKTTSLKALQFNMRSPTVVDAPIEFGKPVTADQINNDVIPYNKHDVTETKRFALYSMDAINFRLGLIAQFGVDVLNYNDTKIGEKMLEQRLGDAVCYDRSTGRKQKRQTPRRQIALSDIIFPYVQFQNPEFQRVLDFMKAQVLTPDDLDDPDAPIKTKGVFTGLHADFAGLTFHFGTGGVHASVAAQRFTADENHVVRDIDVEGLYPNLARVNRLAPEHLGAAFVTEYAKIPAERKTHAKGTQQNATLKLAANGAWGKSNSKFSVFYDPKYAMTIPINGQLLICMLAEWLAVVPTLQFIQANTDGITYRVRREYLPQCVEIEKRWEQFTLLTLESADYSHMWIRDVNNYIARDTKGKLKQKGAYWHPDALNYAESISKASPPCWYKDLGGVVIVRAAVAAMVDGVDPGVFIRAHGDAFDFMLRAKADRNSQLWLGDMPVQKTTRYYVARNGAPMVKIAPPPDGCTIGTYKRKNGVSLAHYMDVMRETGGQWHPDVCTGNKSKYENRRTAIQAGWLVSECNNAAHFDFNNVNYDFYINEAKKLII